LKWKLKNGMLWIKLDYEKVLTHKDEACSSVWGRKLSNYHLLNSNFVTYS
jgi:hypothetical protein